MDKVYFMPILFHWSRFQHKQLHEKTEGLWKNSSTCPRPHHWPAEDSGQAPRLAASLELKTTKNIFFPKLIISVGYFLLQAGDLGPLVQRVNEYVDPFSHALHNYTSTTSLCAHSFFLRASQDEQSSLRSNLLHYPGLAFPSGIPQHWVHYFIIALTWSQTSWVWNLALLLISMWPWTSYKLLVLNPFIYKMDKIILPSSLSCSGMM